MTSRASHLAAAVIGLAAILAGCAPTATAPQPTPTFSSDAEAFAAAEATYREYVKALNAVDLSDPETFEGVYAWTTGDANAGEREALTRMHADGWVVDGATAIALIEPSGPVVRNDAKNIELAICLDISAVTVVDASGRSVVEDARPDVQSMSITLIPGESSPTRLLISSIDGREGEPLCEA